MAQRIPTARQERYSLVVFCGDTNPALVTRLKEKYEIAGKAVVFGPGMGVVLKGDGGKASKS